MGDISLGLQKLREFLLGRKYVPHNRFPPLISPRSIPPPDIPRGPEERYANQYYFRRSALQAVKPPIVAPIAEAAKKLDPKDLKFARPPTPGPTWWWDGHCYYETVPNICRPPPTPPDPCDPSTSEQRPCIPPERPQIYCNPSQK